MGESSMRDDSTSDCDFDIKFGDDRHLAIKKINFAFWYPSDDLILYIIIILTINHLYKLHEMTINFRSWLAADSRTPFHRCVGRRCHPDREAPDLALDTRKSPGLHRVNKRGESTEHLASKYNDSTPNLSKISKRKSINHMLSISVNWC